MLPNKQVAENGIRVGGGGGGGGAGGGNHKLQPEGEKGRCVYLGGDRLRAGLKDTQAANHLV